MENNQKEEMQTEPHETATEVSVENASPKKGKSFKKFFWLTLLLLIVAYTAYSKWDGKINRWYRWSEEVELSSGEVIWVNRSNRYYQWSSSFGNAGGSRNAVRSISFNAKKMQLNLPEWEFKVAKPMLLDFDAEKNRWFVVATFIMCRDWAAWGYPMPPYRLYELQDNQWQLVPFDEKLIGRKGNLLERSPDSFLFRAEVTIEERIQRDWNMGEKFKIIGADSTNCSKPRGD